MKTELMPEQITEMGKKWFDMVVSALPVEEVMSKYRPEDRLKGLSLEEIELYLKKMREKMQ